MPVALPQYPGQSGPVGQPFVTPPTGGVSLVSPQFPGLSNDFASWLQGLLGQGATPFTGSSALPSTGGQTGPGNLAAPLTPLLQSLQQFFQTGGKEGLALPGMDSLNELSATGSPVTTLPAWQTAVNAMQRNIDQGRGNVREQFAGFGTLAGTPFAQAITDYENQAVLGQNALLAQSEAGALEAAQGRRLSASSAMFQPMLTAATELGKLLQGLDQESIRATFAEFVRTQPEYGPLLNLLYGLSTLSPQPVGATASPGVGGQIAQGAASILGLPTGNDNTVAEEILRRIFGGNAAPVDAATVANAVPNIGIPGLGTGAPALGIGMPAAGPAFGSTAASVGAGAAVPAGVAALPALLGAGGVAGASVPGVVAAGTGALSGTGIVGAGTAAAGTGAGGAGLGSSLIALASNPITIAAAAAVGGIMLGRHYIGRGRRTADQITRTEQPKVDAALQDAQNEMYNRNASSGSFGARDIQNYFNELDQIGEKFITFLNSGDLGPNDKKAIQQAAKTIQGRINTMKNMTAQNFAPYFRELANWQSLPTFGYNPSATRQT